MEKKKTFSTSTLWWLDAHIVNTSVLKFKYSKFNNIFFVNISQSFYYFFFLINKRNSNGLLLLNLDAVILKSTPKNYYYLATQTVFGDYRILTCIKFINYIQSISQVFAGNTWIERELKEFNEVIFLNLIDTRKLLSNYNYETDLNYTHFNEIVNDISA